MTYLKFSETSNFSILHCLATQNQSKVAQTVASQGGFYKVLVYSWDLPLMETQPSEQLPKKIAEWSTPKKTGPVC